MNFIKRFVSTRKPWLFENSKVPIFLSYFAPIEIFALSLGPFVFCREKMSTRTRTHETIHYHQHLELLFIGFWVLYVLFWLRGLLNKKGGAESYRSNPFELEAYDNDENESYLSERPLYNWVKYL